MGKVSFSEAIKIASLSPLARGDGKRVAEAISYIVSGEKKTLIKGAFEKIIRGESLDENLKNNIVL